MREPPCFVGVAILAVIPFKAATLAVTNPNGESREYPVTSPVSIPSGWTCAYGDYPCGKPHECHYELYTDRLVKEWVQDDREQSQAEWQAERIQLHALGERREPLRGRFNGISQDIFYPRQPEYYLESLGISGLTFKPFAKIKVSNSFMYLYVDLGNSLKKVSKSKRRKAIRYGKPLPKDVSGKIDELCNQAIRHYWKH